MSHTTDSMTFEIFVGIWGRRLFWQKEVHLSWYPDSRSGCGRSTHLRPTVGGWSYTSSGISCVSAVHRPALPAWSNGRGLSKTWALSVVSTVPLTPSTGARRNDRRKV